MSKKKNTAAKSKKTAKTGDKLLKAALATTAANIARIEAAERAPRATPGRTSKTAAKAKAAKATKPAKERRPSGLDLAAKVLAASKEPLAARTIAERTVAAGWKTSGKTPHATLYAAIIREIAAKGSSARFKKTDRGLFTAHAGAK